MKTIATSLRHWAAERGTSPALIHLEGGVREVRRVTYAELHDRAAAIAARLVAEGVRGRPVLLVYPSDPEFIAAFFGCVLAGAIAVPVPASGAGPGRTWERARTIAASARPAAVLTLDRMMGGPGAATAPELAALPWFATDRIAATPGERADDVTPDHAAPVLLQYTSGSTGAPKGVTITHGNLRANIDMMVAAFGSGPQSRFVSWLPLFHDMGLITALLQGLDVGAPCVLMPPAAFLQQPRRWLEALSRYGGTFSGAPNFAFDLCVARVRPDQVADLDLSAWEVAYCAAEPVRPATLKRFAEHFAPAGFRADSLRACYGLAEATVFVSAPAGRAAPRARLLPGMERPVAACGRPWGQGRVVIVDPATGRPLPDGSEGEVWVAGPHVSPGYWNDPDATAETFGARLFPGDSSAFLRTGDLGAMADGDLHITGRLKDLLLVRGVSHHPQDVEDTLTACHPALASGRAGAFAIDLGDREEVVAVAEIDRHHLRDLDAHAVVTAALEAVVREHGIRLYDVALLRPGGLPRTSSGKVQRTRCRQLYLADALRVICGTPSVPSLGRARAERPPLQKETP